MFDAPNTQTTPVLSAATIAKLWSAVLPEDGVKMLADGMPLSLVKPLYAGQLEYLEYTLVSDLLLAAIGDDRYARDIAAVHRWCINVVDTCAAANLSHTEMFGAISPSAIKISHSGADIASRLSSEVWYVMIDSGRISVHDGYELLSMMLPLTAWHMLGMPGQYETTPAPGFRAHAPEVYDGARAVAARTAAVYAQLIRRY